MTTELHSGMQLEGDVIGVATYDMGSAASPIAEGYIGTSLFIADEGNIKAGLYGLDADYFTIQAHDNDAANGTWVEVARVSAATDPYFSMGGSQEFKFYNSGVALFGGAVTVGSNGTGHDILFYSATAGCSWLWDESDDRVTQLAVFGNATGNEYAYKLTITDATTASQDMHRGIVVDLTSSGNKTGSAHLECFSADMTITHNTPEATVIGIYATPSGQNPTIGNMIGLDVYFEDMGSGVGNEIGVLIGINAANVASSRHANLWLRTHSGEALTSILVDCAAVIGIDMNNSVFSTADIRFSNGATLLDDGTSLTLDVGSGYAQVDTTGVVALNLAKSIQLTEMTAPGAGAANTARIYAVVGGDTLTDLAVVFQDGTVDIFAQEATDPDSPIFQFPDATDLKLTMRKPDRKTIQFVATFPDGREFVMRELGYPTERWN